MTLDTFEGESHRGGKGVEVSIEGIQRDWGEMLEEAVREKLEPEEKWVEEFRHVREEIKEKVATSKSDIIDRAQDSIELARRVDEDSTDPEKILKSKIKQK